LSGDTASFLAGGELPIPIAQSSNSNSITVEWKRYGVGLAFTPTVLNGGLINLKIEPEVSQLDPNNQVPIGGGLPPIPAIIVRRAATTIELRDGQSFMIGGLLQNEAKANVEQLPWLGSLPVLGALFSSRSYLRKESDLAIIVTPRLVKPARPGSVIATPLDNTIPANDPDFFLTGNAELTRPDQRALTGWGAPFSGHMLDLPKGATDVVAVRN
jgi:pilus assembly protein CpaC